MPWTERENLLSRTYGAYGESASPSRTWVRYVGERIETDTGWYLLGARPYSPMLRRFLAPDATSPFEDGGVNRYAYSGGDPIDRVDPTGESWTDWILPAVAIVFAAAATVASAGALAGMLLPAAGAAAGAVATPTLAVASAAAVADTVALAATVGSTVTMATRDPKLNGIFGWVALGSGLASGVALPMAAKQGASIGSKLGNVASDAPARAVQGAAGPAARASSSFAATMTLRSVRTSADIASASGLLGNGAQSDALRPPTPLRPQAMPIARRWQIPDDDMSNGRAVFPMLDAGAPATGRGNVRRGSTLRASWRPVRGTTVRASASESNAVTPGSAQQSLGDIGTMFTGAPTGMVDQTLLTALNVLRSALDDSQQKRPSP